MGNKQKPQRIQRKRTKGWKMPPNTVYVGRGSRWGNPYIVGTHGSAKECVRLYEEMMLPYKHHGPTSNLQSFYESEANLIEMQQTLRGKNLACWCKEKEPCHADFLLEMANTGGIND